MKIWIHKKRKKLSIYSAVDLEAEMRLKLIENARLKTGSKVKTTSSPRDKNGGKNAGNSGDKKRSESKEGRSESKSEVDKSDKDKVSVTEKESKLTAKSSTTGKPYFRLYVQFCSI